MKCEEGFQLCDPNFLSHLCIPRESLRPPCMTRTAFLSAVVAAFAIFTASIEAKDTRHYQLVSQDGSRIPATIVWENISGLGSVWGDFSYAAGEQNFSGKNSQPGYLTLRTENGIVYEFWRQNGGANITWSGKVHFTGHSESAWLVSTEPAEVCSVKPATIRHYTATDGQGYSVSATIRWANIDGLGSVEGEFSANGNSVSFSGENSRAGFLCFRDTLGNYYEFHKTTTSWGEVRWVGSGSLTNGTTQHLSLLAN